jgi:hypothetical protein
MTQNITLLFKAISKLLLCRGGGPLPEKTDHPRARINQFVTRQKNQFVGSTGPSTQRARSISLDGGASGHGASTSPHDPLILVSFTQTLASNLYLQKLPCKKLK